MTIVDHAAEATFKVKIAKEEFALLRKVFFRKIFYSK